MESQSVAAGTRSPALTIALCFAVMVIEGFDIQAMGVAAPQMGPELQMSREVLGQALSSSNIGLVFGAILGGWMADRFGRKPVLIGSVVTFGLFTYGTTLAQDFDTLFAMRLLTGLGFGSALPNVMAIAADMARADNRGATSAMMFCGMPAGGCIVALISWLNSDSDWRLLFQIGGLIPLVLAPILIMFMDETRKPTRETRTMSDVLPWLVVIPVGLIAWALLREVGKLPGAGSVAGISAWLGGVIGIMGGYLAAHRKPLFAEGRTPASLLLWLIFLPTLAVLYLVLNWLPSLVAAKGYAEDASLSSVMFNAFSVVGALAVGFLADKRGLRIALTGSFALLVVVLLALANASGLIAILLLSGALGFFVLGANYALYGAAAAYYPPEVRGRGSGASVAWGRIGAVIGPLVGGFMLQGGATPGDVVYAMAPFAIVSAIGAALLTTYCRQAR